MDLMSKNTYDIVNDIFATGILGYFIDHIVENIDENSELYKGFETIQDGINFIDKTKLNSNGDLSSIPLDRYHLSAKESAVCVKVFYNTESGKMTFDESEDYDADSCIILYTIETVCASTGYKRISDIGMLTFMTEDGVCGSIKDGGLSVGTDKVISIRAKSDHGGSSRMSLEVTACGVIKHMLSISNACLLVMNNALKDVTVISTGRSSICLDPFKNKDRSLHLTNRSALRIDGDKMDAAAAIKDILMPGLAHLHSSMGEYGVPNTDDSDSSLINVLESINSNLEKIADELRKSNISNHSYGPGLLLDEDFCEK